MILACLEELKGETDWPYERLCREAGVSPSSLMRWKTRHERGEPLVTSPGPRKTGPLDLAALKAVLAQLAHGHHRTGGTGDLYEQYRAQLSRRRLLELVAQARAAFWREREGGRQRIYWHAPRLIWAVDDVMIGHTANGRLFCNHIQDLSSRYKMPPALTEGHVMAGEQVAERLNDLFEVYGPPLVLKRDNGSNLDCAAVDVVLGRHWVTPLNSPRHYPPYNGGIEKAQRDYKEALAEMGDGDQLELKERLILSQLAIGKLNEQFRRSLHGHSAYWSFETGLARQREYTTRHRKEAVEEMNVMAIAALTEPGVKKPLSPEAAWRLAVQSWLQSHGMITIAMERNVLPIFP
jgi:transposase InsO family protein